MRNLDIKNCTGVFQRLLFANVQVSIEDRQQLKELECEVRKLSGICLPGSGIHKRSVKILATDAAVTGFTTYRTVQCTKS